jgi:hypothetical protein
MSSLSRSMGSCLAVLLAMAIAGCTGGECRQLPHYPYADIFTVDQPTSEQITAALRAHGWNVTEDGPANATYSLADGRTARIIIPSPRGHGLMMSATGDGIYTPEESHAVLAIAADPLASALDGTVIYYGGPEHCGEI